MNLYTKKKDKNFYKLIEFIFQFIYLYFFLNL